MRKEKLLKNISLHGNFSLHRWKLTSCLSWDTLGASLGPGLTTPLGAFPLFELHEKRLVRGVMSDSVSWSLLLICARRTTKNGWMRKNWFFLLAVFRAWSYFRLVRISAHLCTGLLSGGVGLIGGWLFCTCRLLSDEHFFNEIFDSSIKCGGF